MVYLTKEETIAVWKLIRERREQAAQVVSAAKRRESVIGAQADQNQNTGRE